MPQLHCRSRYVLVLALAGLITTPCLPAQDNVEPSKTAAGKSYDTSPGPDKPLSLADQSIAEKLRLAAKYDSELFSRLENTVWNDLDLSPGAAGQLWMLRSPKLIDQRIERAWHLNDSKSVPRVGSWEVKNGELLLKAMNGTIMGRGKYAEDEIVGKFISADQKREYGQFRLREETKRNYRVLTMREQYPARRQR